VLEIEILKIIYLLSVSLRGILYDFYFTALFVFIIFLYLFQFFYVVSFHILNIDVPNLKKFTMIYYECRLDDLEAVSNRSFSRATAVSLFRARSTPPDTAPSIHGYLSR
jgi:hypothetical protein